MNACQNRLNALTRELRAKWDETRQYWTDAKSLEFEKRFLDELLAQVNQTIASLDTLERVLGQVRDDCD